MPADCRLVGGKGGGSSDTLAEHIDIVKVTQKRGIKIICQNSGNALSKQICSMGSNTYSLLDN